jgi:hypothetical protein
VSLLSLEFNDETNATKFYVNKLNIFDLINARVSTSDLTNALTYYALYSETYTKTISNSLFNGKLNNNTGTISTSIKNNGGEDVAIFYNTKDVNLKGNVNVFNDLAVYGTTILSNKLKIQCAGGGGNIRAVPAFDNAESSIGFYRYTDMREAEPNSMWVAGQNCWNNQGFSIGTPGRDSCFNIDSSGNVSIPYNLYVSGNLLVNGIIVDNERSLNPFWICGKVAANGTVLSNSRGKYSYTVNKNGTGSYTISPTNANFSDTNYIVNITCQVDNGYAHARVGSSSLGLSSFLVAVYVNNSLADCIFNFSVIYRY